MNTLLQIGLWSALLGIAYALWSAWWVVRQPMGDALMQAPYQAIREGAAAFMRTQYGTIALVGAAIFLVLWLAPHYGLLTALGFLVGGLFSGLSGYIGMNVSVRANVRTAAAA